MAAVRVRKFKFTTTVIVKPNWIEDGFDIDENKVVKQLKGLLPYAIDNEILVKVNKIRTTNITIPSYKKKREDGYK